MGIDARHVVMVAVGLGVGLLAIQLTKTIGAVSSAVAGAAGQAVDMADKVVSTPVLAIGDAVGIPRTNESECQRAIREGRTWDASFACPAGDFLSYLVG